MKTLRKILVVDDDPVVGKSFDRVLSGRGYVVITANDGAEALRKIADEKYDAVFTDIKMPGMDGIEVARHIKSQQPWLPVVIVSGYATTENEARAREAGVSTIMHKPLSPEMIENGARDAMLEKDVTVPAVLVAANDSVLVETSVKTRSFPIINWIKNIALLGAAPFLGLAYVIALPFVGLGMLAWMGTKAAVQRVNIG